MENVSAEYPVSVILQKLNKLRMTFHIGKLYFRHLGYLKKKKKRYFRRLTVYKPKSAKGSSHGNYGQHFNQTFLEELFTGTKTISIVCSLAKAILLYHLRIF